MQPVFAQSTVTPQRPGDPGYDALLQAATAPLQAQLGDTVRVDVERLDRLGRWAFLQGTMRAAEGGRPDFADTLYADRASEGGMSDVYVALLQADEAADDQDQPPPSGDVHDGGKENDVGDTTVSETEITEWTLVDHAIGPSDVSWLNWPQDHAAPRQLFGF